MSELPNAYAQTEDFEFGALQKAHNYRRALLDGFSNFLTGKVLEVGAGVGQMTGELLKIPGITELVSLEPDDRFFNKLRLNFPAHKTIHGTIDVLPKESSWNSILNINVLEHIKDDCGELLNYYRLLAPERGHLCLFVPARPEIYAPIDRDFGHFRRYTKPELHQKITAAGFEILKLHYFNIAGYFAWWLKFCVLKQQSFGVGSVGLFDRAIFPITHGLESLICPPPFGQSLLAVARAK